MTGGRIGCGSELHAVGWVMAWHVQATKEANLAAARQVRNLRL
jgi:hypothetical protein